VRVVVAVPRVRRRVAHGASHSVADGARVQPVIPEFFEYKMAEMSKADAITYHLRVISIPTGIPDLTENYLRF
jgi:hypothetical protein